MKFSIKTGSIFSDVINDAAHLEKKSCGPDAMMRRYGGADAPRSSYVLGPLSRTCVIALRIETLRAQRAG